MVALWQHEERPPTWHHHLVAALATVAVLYGAAFAAHELAVVAGVEGLRGQVLVALSAAEAALVPVAVLVVQLLQHMGGGHLRVSGGGPACLLAMCTAAKDDGLLILYHISSANKQH